MGKCYIFTEEELTALADSIRIKAGTEDKMTMSEMCQAIRDIPSGVVAKYGVTDTYDFAELTSTGTQAQRCKMFSKYIGYHITTIDSSAFYLSTIEEFDFPLLATISSAAFQECAALREVEIQASVTSIGDSAFRDCINLVRTEFKNTLQTLANNIFYGCSKLASLIFPSGLTSIGSYAFYNCVQLNLLELPSTLTSIGSYAFNGCVTLAIDDIPDSVTRIDSYAFNGCSNVEFDKLPANLTSLGSYAFQNCPKVTIHEMNTDNWTALPNYVFSYATGITHFTLPSALSRVPQYAFQYCSALSEIIFQHDNTIIDQYAFMSCIALEEINLSKVKSILYGAFTGAGLKKLKIYSTTTSIESNAFDCCTRLEDVDLLEATGLTTLTSYVFRNCTALKVITIPSTVKTINSNVFQNCTGLKKIFFKDRPTTLNSSAFSGCASVTDIYVPWTSGAVSGAPWGATNAIVHYDTVYDQDLTGLSTSDGLINNVVGSTRQVTFSYIPDPDLIKPDQLGVTYEITSGSEYATVDSEGLVTIVALPPVNTVISVVIKSIYDPNITATCNLTVVHLEVSYNLNDGQWVDSGTRINDHIVYKSDLGSYHVSSGLSRMSVTINGYTEFKVMLRSNGESNYDYAEIGALDAVNVSRNNSVFNTRGRASATQFYEYTFTNIDGGTHTFEVLYSKDGSGDNNEDRGFVYFPDVL